MKRKYMVSIILIAVAATVLIIYLYGGHQTPPGQAPLEDLTAQNVADLKSAFNAANNDVRVLLLLSPT